MATWIALLRGVNVGGHNRLSMKDLRDVLAAIGLGNPRTYIQSGNCAFESHEPDASAVRTRVADAICRAFGFTPDLMVLDLKEFERIVDAVPFRSDDPGHLHIWFLSRTPDTPDLKRIADTAVASEDWTLGERAFYLHAPDGIGRSKLAARAESLLGVSATARNMKSAKAILDLARG